MPADSETDVDTVLIDHIYAPPSRLQVSTATRRAFVASYLPHTVFRVKRREDLIQWLRSLPVDHLDPLTQVRYDVEAELFAGLVSYCNRDVRREHFVTCHHLWSLGLDAVIHAIYVKFKDMRDGHWVWRNGRAVDEEEEEEEDDSDNHS